MRIDFNVFFSFIRLNVRNVSRKLISIHSVLKNLNGSQQLPRTDLELVKIEPGTRKGLIFIIKNLENNRIDHYMSYNQPDALSNFRLQCRWVRIDRP